MGVTDELFSGGYPSIKFERVGDEIEGVVVEIDSMQETDFATKKPVCWDDGSPKMVPIFVLQTDIKDSDEDDGLRAVYCRAGVFTAVRKALIDGLRPTKMSDPAVLGGVLKVRFHATAPSQKGSPRKVFLAKFTKRQGTAAMAAQGAAQGVDESNPPPVDW